MSGPIVAEKRPGPGALLADLIEARLNTGLEDLFFLFLDTGITYGMGLPLERHPNPKIDAVVQQLLKRWHAEEGAGRASAGDPDADPRRLFDELPAWLLSLPNRKEPNG